MNWREGGSAAVIRKLILLVKLRYLDEEREKAPSVNSPNVHLVHDEDTEGL